MITLVKILSTSLKDGYRKLKTLQFGNKTAYECSPFGEDSNPLENMRAIYAETSNIKERVIIGYVNTNQLAEKGEKRLYSLDSDGSVSSFVWLKNDGKIEVNAENGIELNGNSHNAVRFSPLDAGISSKDASINAELIKIQVALANIGGVYTPGTISTDISGAESDTVKLG